MSRHPEKQVSFLALLIGHSQATADRKSTDSTAIWTPELLREAYAAAADATLGLRLRAVLDWALIRGAILVTSAKRPVFGVRSLTGGRLLTIYPDGAVYWWMEEARHPGGSTGRNRLAEVLQPLGLAPTSLDFAEVVSGRNLGRRLQDLTDTEFEKLLSSLGEFCPPPSGTCDRIAR